MSTADVRVMVAEDAAARVAGLGMQREFEQMLEHAKEIVPDLLALRVSLEYNPEYPSEEPMIVILAHRKEPLPEELSGDKTDWDYGGWMVQQFPPRVRTHFVLISVYGDPDGW